MVRIHSPRPFIPFLFNVVTGGCSLLALQPLFRHCAQNCAYPAHFARAPSPPGPCPPAGEHSGASLRNRCGRPGTPACTGPCTPPTASGKCGGTCRARTLPPSPIRYAFGCCFFSVDFSMCPLLVGAGKTHSPLATARRISMNAISRGVRGMVRRAFSVLPKGT